MGVFEVSDEVNRLQREGALLFLDFEMEAESDWDPARVELLARRFSSLLERCEALLAQPSLPSADREALLREIPSARLHMRMCLLETNPGPVDAPV